MHLNLNWQAQQNEVEQPSKTGEVLARVNIKTADIPFGFLWTGTSILTNAEQKILNQPTFAVMFNTHLLKKDIPNQEEAIQFAEAWYSEKALFIADQVEKAKAATVAGEPEVVVGELVNNESN